MGSGYLYGIRSFLGDYKPPKATFLPENYPDLTDKVALVTGANTGIGFTAAQLLLSKNCFVIITVRSKAKGEDAVKRLKAALGENEGNPVGKADFIVIELSDLATVKGAAEQVFSKTDKLNIIIHNAGVFAPPAESRSAQGHDLQMGTNVMGPFLFQKYLDPLFLKPNTTFKRLVWATSSCHAGAPPNGGIQWDDINFETSHDMMLAYAQSKAANYLLAGIWPQHYPKEVKEQDIVSVSVHPGVISSDMRRNLPKLMLVMVKPLVHPVEYGAYSELFAALSPTLTTKDNGAYIIPWGAIGDPRDDVRESITNGNGERLWTYLTDVTSCF